MTAQLGVAVELLDRSLAYTRVMLADVRPTHLHRPSPCADWTLEQLLAHMEDALDAFTEAAAGRVALEPVPASGTRIEALRDKACALLGAWTAARSMDDVAVGDADLEAPLLVSTAALEITVHGWDVAQVTGRRARIPDALAAGLLPVARRVIAPADRGVRFASPCAAPAAAPSGERLLAWTGREPMDMTEPLAGNSGERTARRGLAS